MDIDGVHLCIYGAFLILHRQIELPQAHTIGEGVARGGKKRCQVASGRTKSFSDLVLLLQ